MNRNSEYGPKLLVALAALALSGAPALAFSLDDLNPFGPSKYEQKVDPQVPADHFYNEGLTKLDKGDYEGAAKKFGELQKKHPFTQHARKALLMEVYANYRDGKATDTTTAADRYLTLYPTSPEAAYVTYLAGQVLFENMPDIHRDQGNMVRAMKYFQAVVEKYPKSEYAADARYKLQVARDQLAAYELNVGRFYMKKENYAAAINRFREVLFKYQTTREAEEALERLTECYLAIGVTHEAQTAAAVLGANYPNSPFYQDAFDRLKGQGLSPKESQDSWISKLFRSS
ncbi:outer membrane protein assembly factor BamD [Rhodoblastus acidophilus]|uniref:outer membrane protein assembly factor BamD n=1 Tax=Rhodoblastus acidophilus TaxID=1074 RepID=UPI001618D9D5|nr:outer membrane protein assembly factor BamD [Rhodoblastus acidophilus]MCW2283931.1 outer membrane protein assembly factor BamD [Rhodoblastus acidophilus]MCW2332627.1 outer membrane protein assembly factor BamD [Rhodoblastus acidophilus]